MWVSVAELSRGAEHPFYERLDRILEAAGFDSFVPATSKWLAGSRVGKRGD